jgi:RimJ/RimL family protein N-acetyltransferase
VTPEVTLERFGERHLPDLEALVHDPEVLRFTRVPDPPPPGFARTWLDHYQEGERNGGSAGFMAYAADSTLAGVGVAPNVNVAGRELELGYIVAAEQRGRGYAGAILDALTRWALFEWGALRIVLYIGVENGPSLRVAERAGYTREGTLRNSWFKQELRGDTALFSLLPGDAAAPRPA